nr:type 2 C1q domain-containing protein [Biomphalaria glabrata]
MACRLHALFVLSVFISEVSLLSQVTDANKKRLWWGKYSFDTQSDVSSPGSSAPGGEHINQRSPRDDSDHMQAYRSISDSSASTFRAGHSRTEQEPKYQKISENSNLWEESDYRPFRGLDTEDTWLDKTNRMSEECSCDEKLKELEKKLSELQDDSNRLSAKVWDTVDVVQSLVKGNSKIGKQKHIISFAAQAASNIPYLKDTEVIVFDDVLVNNGAAYDARSGIFTVPVSGVYIFTATIVSGFNSTIETMLTMNGQEVARIYSGAYKNRGSGSNAVLLNLKEGDEIWVALFYGNGNYVHGKWSSFSGALIETY